MFVLLFTTEIMIDEAQKGDTSGAGGAAISTSGHIIEPLETRQALA